MWLSKISLQRKLISKQDGPVQTTVKEVEQAVCGHYMQAMHTCRMLAYTPLIFQVQLYRHSITPPGSIPDFEMLVPVYIASGEGDQGLYAHEK